MANIRPTTPKLAAVMPLFSDFSSAVFLFLFSSDWLIVFSIGVGEQRDENAWGCDASRGVCRRGEVIEMCCLLTI